MLGEREPVQPLAEVLDHVLALGLAVHEHVEADVLLVGDHLGDRALQEALVVRLRARRADLRRLRERADRRRRQLRQRVPGALRLAAHLERRVALVGAGRAPAHLRVQRRRPARVADLARGARAARRGRRPARPSARPARPASRPRTPATAGSRSVLARRLVGHVQERARRRDRDRSEPSAATAASIRSSARSRSAAHTLRPSSTPSESRPAVSSAARQLLRRAHEVDVDLGGGQREDARSAGAKYVARQMSIGAARSAVNASANASSSRAVRSSARHGSSSCTSVAPAAASSRSSCA